MLCSFYLSFLFKLKTFSLALHPPFFFFRLKTFIVRASNKFSGSIFCKLLFVFFSFVYYWLSLSSTFFLFLCITLTLFFFFFFFKCNFWNKWFLHILFSCCRYCDPKVLSKAPTNFQVLSFACSSLFSFLLFIIDFL